MDFSPLIMKIVNESFKLPGFIFRAWQRWAALMRSSLFIFLLFAADLNILYVSVMWDLGADFFYRKAEDVKIKLIRAPYFAEMGFTQLVPTAFDTQLLEALNYDSLA